jgi:hypothetical protein
MASNDCPIQFIYLSIYDMQTIFLVGHKTTLLNHPSVSLYFYFILLIKEPFIHLKQLQQNLPFGHGYLLSLGWWV